MQIQSFPALEIKEKEKQGDLATHPREEKENPQPLKGQEMEGKEEKTLTPTVLYVGSRVYHAKNICSKIFWLVFFICSLVIQTNVRKEIFRENDF